MRSNFIASRRERHASWYRYCRRPAASVPTPWMCPFASGQIQTSFHAGGIASESMRARISGSRTALPDASTYVKPRPRRRRAIPGPSIRALRSRMPPPLGPRPRDGSRATMRTNPPEEGRVSSGGGGYRSCVGRGDRADTRDRQEGQVDALRLLKDDHERVKKMLEEIDSTTERAEKTRTEGLAKLKQELTIHEAIEEEIFYPALRQHAEAKEIVL